MKIGNLKLAQYTLHCVNTLWFREPGDITLQNTGRLTLWNKTTASFILQITRNYSSIIISTALSQYNEGGVFGSYPMFFS